MSALTEALREIDTWIQTSQSDHATRLRENYYLPIKSGLEQELIELYSEEFNFSFSEEVYELYQWHDEDILVGDLANPVYFVSLDSACKDIVQGHCPYRPYIPLFTGDEAYWVVPEASDSQQSSPLFFYDGFISGGKPTQNGIFRANTYAPSITALMQAMAECTRIYDGISAYWMDEPLVGRRTSILSPIYQKYGVVGHYSGLWN